MSNYNDEVVLNFKMNGQVQYAQTIKEINSVMNTAAKEYKNHIAAMSDEATATDKLRAEKQKLEIQMEGAQKRTQMLRSEYEKMSKDTNTTTKQLTDMYSKLLDSERAESSLQKSLDRVNDGLSDQAQESRNAKETLDNLKKESSSLEAEQKKLTSSFKLQESQLGDNADESEKLELAQRQLASQTDLTNRTVENLEKQLEATKKIYGENSVEVMQMETKINNAKSSISELNKKLDSTKSSGNNAADGLENMNKMLGAAVLLEAAEQLQGIADKMIEISKAAMETSLAMGDSQTNLQANLGLTEKEAENLNKVVDEVFRNGVVGSIEEANEAVVLVKRSFGDLDDVQLEKLTNNITTIAKRTGTDVKENVRGAEQMMKSFGIKGEEALDLIASGYQKGLNKSDDFMDTLNEYSPHFKAAGYSANEMLQIIQNGMQNGAQNTDKAADAVKELQIRLGDGSYDKIIKGYSKETQTMFKKWQDGKATTSDVANSISKDLKKMSPNEQQKALSELSTQFEDLGVKGAAALFNVGKGFNDVNGKADEMAKKSPTEKWESSMRELQEAALPIGENLVNALTPVVDVLSKMTEWFSKLPGPIQTFIIVFGGITAVATILIPLIAGLAFAFGSLNIALLPIIGIIAGVAAAIAGIVLVIQNWGTITDWLSKKWDQFKTWITNLIDQIAQWFSKTFGEIKDSIVKSVSEAIKSAKKSFGDFKEYISSTFSEISKFFSKIWSAIKKTFSDVTSSIVSFVVGKFNSLKKSVSSIFSSIKNVISSIWKSILKVVSNVVSSISNVVSKIFNGLKNIVAKAMDKVKSAVESGWKKAKSFLDNINLIKTGKEIINGLIKGITNMGGKLKEKVKDIADSVIKTFKKVLDIHSPSRKTDKIGQETGQGYVNGLDKKKKAAEAAAKRVAAAALKSFNSKMQNHSLKFKAGKIDVKDYVDSLEKMKKQYAKVPNAVVKINAQIKKLNDESSKDLLSKYEKTIDEKVKYENMGYAAQIAAWQKYIKNFKKGSDEYVSIQDKLKDLKYNQTQEKIKINNDYLANVEQLNDKLIADEKALEDAYTQSFENRKNQLYSWKGIFDEVTRNTEITGQSLITNLEGQISAFADWQNALNQLSGKGLSEELVTELRDMGPNAVDQIVALNSLTDEQLIYYNQLWEEKSKLATETTTNELKNLRGETDKQIIKLREEAAVQLKAYQKEWQKSMKDTVGKAKAEFKKMPSIGAYAITGLIDGLNSKKEELKSVAQEIASIVTSAANKTSILTNSAQGMKIDWHAKGGIMTRPTIFGRNGNRLMGGGEAGAEAILPLNEKTLGMIGQAIADTMGSNKGDTNIHITTQDNPNAIAQAVERAERRVAFGL